MMATRTPLAALGFLILFAMGGGCGGWNTDPFRPGTTRVEGRLTGSYRAESSWVGVLGNSSLKVPVAEDGTFELEEIPSGPVTIIASDGEGSAARMPIELYTNRTRDLELPMDAGVRIDGEILLPTGEVLWATATLPELPLAPFEITSGDGRFELRGLPWGAMELVLEHPGYETYLVALDSVPGDELTVTAVLRPLATGSGASCEACLSGADCATGLCLEDDESSGETTCAVLCVDDLDCPGAYVCKSVEGSQARACRPKDASCDAIRATVEARNCEGDEDCGETGVCLGNTCTLECSDDSGCPGGGRCRPHASEPVDACE